MADPKPVVYGVRDGQFIPLDADGSFIDNTPYVPVAVRAATAGSGGADWPGAVETAAGAVSGGDDASGDSVVEDDFTGEADGDSTPLGDAQPFDYRPDMPDGDMEELAGGEGTPNNNQAQNKQFKAVVKALGLNQDQARQLHEEISKQGLGYHEMLERGQDMFGGSDD